jgi:hypothetical protein
VTTVRDCSARAVGILRVREQDYPDFLSICEDADWLPATWQRFAEFTEKAERSDKAQGYIVERAYIDPLTFPDWCRSQGLRVNAHARRTFAASIAEKRSDF